MFTDAFVAYSLPIWSHRRTFCGQFSRVIGYSPHRLAVYKLPRGLSTCVSVGWQRISCHPKRLHLLRHSPVLCSLLFRWWWRGRKAIATVLDVVLQSELDKSVLACSHLILPGYRSHIAVLRPHHHPNYLTMVDSGSCGEEGVEPSQNDYPSVPGNYSIHLLETSSHGVHLRVTSGIDTTVQ